MFGASPAARLILIFIDRGARHPNGIRRRRPLLRKKGDIMQGLVLFISLADAIRAGYQIVDQTPDGYVVRTKTAAGWAMALIRDPRNAAAR
jgi:hypothetical protein